MQVARKGIALAMLVALVGLFVATVVPQPVRARDKDDHKGDVDRVKVVNDPTEPVPVTGQINVTLPPVQNVAGTVNVANFPATQNVIAPLAPFGVYNNTVVFPGPTPPQQFVVTPNHDAQLWVSVSGVAPTGQALMGEIVNFSNTTLFQFPMQLVRHDVTCGCDFLSGTAPAPIYIPANSHLTLALTHDVTVVGFFQGSMTITGVLLN